MKCIKNENNPTPKIPFVSLSVHPSVRVPDFLTTSNEHAHPSNVLHEGLQPQVRAQMVLILPV